jgi:toxin ParE1/3/4
VKVQFTPLARNQFLSALLYIRKDKPSAAVRFRHKAEKILRRLEEFPESGRIIPEFPELPYREVVISPYRFFYKIKVEAVWIVAVWHGARIPNEPATQRLGAEQITAKSKAVKSLP